MKSRISRALFSMSAALALVSLSAVGLTAQDDPDPNSPTPVLLSYADSTRALAQSRETFGSLAPTDSKPRAFAPDSTIVIFATNLMPMEGEGANAYRVYSIDKSGHLFRFPVLDVQEIPNSKRIFAITIQLKDQVGFWSAPEADGDVIIYLAWRGLASNSVRLGLGQMGGPVKDALSARPTPWGLRVGAPAGKATRKDTYLAPNYVGYKWSGDRMRFLEQATFGPTAALDNRLRRIGLKTWLAEQFEAQYPSVSNPYPNHPLKPSNAAADCDNNPTVPDVPATCFRDTYTMYQPQTWFFREAFYGDAPLRHRVAWALDQIWVTSGADIQQGRHIVEYQKVIANNTFGNYRDLMKQMTLHPTMGAYLDMAISTRTNPNENYAREIMQLFSIGLFMLNPDGTLQLDQDGDPIPTYTQDGVNNLTKVLTGWSFCSQPASCPNIAIGTVNYIDPMLLNPGVTTINNNRHDLTAKTLLSYPGSDATMNIAACTDCTTTPNATGLANTVTYANASLEKAVDNIFNHPNVGPFVGKILIQHMVASDPTPAYVGRVAAAFNNNGFGVRGDMKAVVRAILLDPEARGDVKTDPNFGKLREPVQFATNILRAFNVKGVTTPQTDGYVTGRGEFTGMAQVPFFSPTVFNFYPPDYGIPGTTLLGPEFAIMTTGTAIQRTNFVWRFIFFAIPIAVAAPNSPNGLALDIADLQALSAADNSGGLLVDELNRRMLHSTMTPSMKSTLQTAVTSYATTDTLNRVRQAIYLVATSSQFQVQR